MGLMRAVFVSVNLTGANLKGANLGRSRLEYADLKDADLTDVMLMGSDLSGANLTGATVAGADFKNVDVSGARLIDLKGQDERQGLVGARERRPRHHPERPIEPSPRPGHHGDDLP